MKTSAVYRKYNLVLATAIDYNIKQELKTLALGVSRKLEQILGFILPPASNT